MTTFQINEKKKKQKYSDLIYYTRVSHIDIFIVQSKNFGRGKERKIRIKNNVHTNVRKP